MSRNLVLAAAALAAVGCLVAAPAAEAGYVLSGLKEYANAPMRTLTAKDCRVTYNGQLRLVSAETFAKYLARHPEFGNAVPATPRRHNIGFSGVTPRFGPAVGSGWAGECARW